VIETDYDACNGIIHVIDAVLVPEAEEECQTIAEIAAADGRFTTLLAAAGIAGLDDELADPDFGPGHALRSDRYRFRCAAGRARRGCLERAAR
jgi:uncharacterized surface protein with fasciclin (FAS1) repeats